MDFDSYAKRAVDLANAPLESLDDLRELLREQPWWHDRVRRQDLAELRAVSAGVREVFELAARDRPTDVPASGPEERDHELATVDALNALLEAHPVRPRISGHDDRDWHLHVTGADAGISAEYAAGAIWGLAVALTRWGTTRFGLCQASNCRNAYLDTSTNASRRFCSDRCATRAHVAAHRARKRDAEERGS